MSVMMAGTCSLLWRDQKQVMGRFLQQQYLLQQLDITTDVTIVSGDGVAIFAHSLVLAACSPFFSTILKSMTTNERSIAIPDTSSSQLQAILSFIYQGETIINMDSIDHFLTLAQQLQISCLNKDQMAHLDCSDKDDIDQFHFFPYNEEVSSVDIEDSSILIPSVELNPMVTNLTKTNLRKERWIVTKKNACRSIETHSSKQSCLTCGETFTNTELMKRHAKDIHNIAEKVSSVKIEDSSSCMRPLVGHITESTDLIRTNLKEVEEKENGDLAQFDFFFNEEEVLSADNEGSSSFIPRKDQNPILKDLIRFNFRKEIEKEEDIDQFEFLPNEEEIAAIDIKKTPSLTPLVNHKTMLMNLIKTNLRKEVEDEKIYWHCLCCDKRWNVTKKNARRHMETHLPKQNCRICGKTFTNTEAMKRHSKKGHNVGHEVTSLQFRTSHDNMKYYDDNNNKTNKEQIFAAVNDGDDLSILDANMMIKNNMNSYESQKSYLTSFKMAKLEMETDGKREYIWQCLICGKNWVAKSMCSRHMEVHIVGLNFPCESCNKAFSSKWTLKKHIQLCRGKLMANYEIREDTLGMVEGSREEGQMLVNSQ